MLSPSQTSVSPSGKDWLRRATRKPRAPAGRHLIEALWMARHQHQQRIGNGHATPGIENQLLLALAGAGRQPDRALADKLSPLPAQIDLVGRRTDIELQVATNLDNARPQTGGRPASPAVCAIAQTGWRTPDPTSPGNVRSRAPNDRQAGHWPA